ncbi:hypothetical protein C8R47DRAFT_1083652 [Mycena vitilis]|nr:hypothetical protein C8R47DRAFT_1083652 [Mycena vitilis]
MRAYRKGSILRAALASPTPARRYRASTARLRPRSTGYRHGALHARGGSVNAARAPSVSPAGGDYHRRRPRGLDVWGSVGSARARTGASVRDNGGEHEAQTRGSTPSLDPIRRDTRAPPFGREIWVRGIASGTLQGEEVSMLCMQVRLGNRAAGRLRSTGTGVPCARTSVPKGRCAHSPVSMSESWRICSGPGGDAGSEEALALRIHLRLGQNAYFECTDRPSREAYMRIGYTIYEAVLARRPPLCMKETATARLAPPTRSTGTSVRALCRQGYCALGPMRRRPTFERASAGGDSRTRMCARTCWEYRCPSTQDARLECAGSGARLSGSTYGLQGEAGPPPYRFLGGICPRVRVPSVWPIVKQDVRGGDYARKGEGIGPETKTRVPPPACPSRGARTVRRGRRGESAMRRSNPRTPPAALDEGDRHLTASAPHSIHRGLGAVECPRSVCTGSGADFPHSGPDGTNLERASDGCILRVCGQCTPRRIEAVKKRYHAHAASLARLTGASNSPVHLPLRLRIRPPCDAHAGAGLSGSMYESGVRCRRSHRSYYQGGRSTDALRKTGDRAPERRVDRYCGSLWDARWRRGGAASINERSSYQLSLSSRVPGESRVAGEMHRAFCQTTARWTAAVAGRSDGRSERSQRGDASFSPSMPAWFSTTHG